MTPVVYEFGDVTVDARRMTVTRAGAAVSLEPKAYDVLRCLLEHRDRLVTKEELLDTVWKDTFVTPNVLTRAIAQLRKALGDDASEARYIQTVARRGYRFIADVRVQNGTEAPPPLLIEAPASLAARHRFRPWWWLAPIIVVLILLALGREVIFRAVGLTAVPSSLATPPHRFSVGSASYASAAIAPDASRVAYSSDQTGAPEIYVRGFAADSPEVQITADGQFNSQPAWSPDGQWIAYASERRKGIWIVSASGGVPRQVVDVGSQPEWAPDGKRLVYSSFAGALSQQATLWIVDIDGTHRRPLTRLGKPKGGHSEPTWSHDGRLIVFTSAYGGEDTGLYLVPVDGGDPWRLTGANGAGTGRFSGDDHAVYFVGQAQDGGRAVLSVPVIAPGHKSEDAVTVMPLVGATVGQLSVARDGTATVIVGRSAPGNLWEVDVAGTGRAHPLTTDDVRDTFPNISPDGRRIAFTQLVGGGVPATSWVMDADGTHREPLSIGTSESIQAPRFSADGRRVLVSLSGKGPPSFGWITLATRQVERMPANGWSPMGAVFPTLSPDNREVAYHVADAQGVSNVWRHDLATGRRQQITFDKEAMTYPVWSPDGQWLAVVIKRGEESQLGVVARDGGPVELVTAEPGQSWTGSWGPDNDQLAFAGYRDGFWNVHVVSRRSKQIRRITDFADVGGYVRFPIWSPTRNAIVFERVTAPRSSIWALKINY